MGYYNLALNKEQRGAYEYAMQNSECRGHVLVSDGAGKCTAA
jgi:hypothetical protein